MRSAVVGRYGDAWKVRVAAPAEAGKANEAVLALLADALDISRRSLELTSGSSSRNKVVALHGLAPDVAAERLAEAAQPA
jgi:uncharacterized protein YggU (UPF0235/DUF167 family)